MASPYFGGKAASLAANEKTVTPKQKSLAKVLQEHDAIHNPHLVKAPVAPKTFGGAAKLRKQYESGARAALTAQYGDKFTKAPAWAQQKAINDFVSKHSVAKDNRSDLEKAVDLQVTQPILSKAPKLASPKLTTPVTVVGKALAEASGVPSLERLPGEIEQHKYAAAGVEAASLLPFGRLGKALKGAKEAEVAAKAAKEIPEGADVVKGALRGARVTRGKQEALYSAERKARVAKATEHLNNQELAPEERIALAKNELKGELPKINFKGFNELNDESIKSLQEHILNHPHLMPYQKIRAAGALTKALSGEVPQKNELDLLQHIFGKETANSLGQIGKHPYKDLILSTLNIPRSLMASFDLSAPFRQGLVIGARHPIIFAKNFKPMVKAFGSEKVYEGILEDIHSRPTYPMMLEGKLAITELSKQVGPREEQFASDIAEHIPVVGHGIRASGRAYTGYLDKLRADVFDHLLQRAQSQGVNVQDEKFLKDLGRLVNDSTGRGSLGKFQGAAKVANALFFSPRLLASRMNIIFAPATYAKADPFVRREALKSMIGLAGTLSTILGVMSQIPGVNVVTDPRNPDWGKIKKGNTRIDIAGGFQQPLRLFAQLYTHTAISSTTGKSLNLTSSGFGQPNRLDLFLRFFEGKEAPVTSIITDWMRNSDQIGNKFTWGNEAKSHLIPLLAQDSYDVYKDQHGGLNGIAAAFGGYGIGSVGFGLQTYGPKKPKAAKASTSYFGGSSGGSSPYFGSPSSGGSAYFGG